MSEENEDLPEEIEQGLAFAYGEETTGHTPHSLIERIGEITGIKPKVLLRDESKEEIPMLSPLEPENRIEAGKYVVHGELGRGGVGSVHRGHDQDLGRDVAMKFLHDKYKDDAALLHRFVEEAQIGGQLQHPGIVPVYDLGLVDGKAFFSMKLVKGQTLAKKLAERSSPTDDLRGFLSIFEDICQTLAYAHARGVVHRDLKPANIMIGSFGEVQVVDWGMGKVLASGGVADEKLATKRDAQQSVIETVRSGGHGTQSLVGSIMGTPAYMPPEQARGDVEAMDERSDVFALGAILCEILTGKPPYQAAELDELLIMAATANQEDAHKRLAECEAEARLVELAKQCLSPAPATRPRSAEVVSRIIHEHLTEVEERVHLARVEAAEAKIRSAALKRTQTLGIGLLCVTVVGLLVSLWFWRSATTAAQNESLARSEAVVSAEEALASKQVAEDKEAIANRELGRALEIKELITGMLQGVDPAMARGADITLLKGILDSASKRLSKGAIQDQLVAAELHYLIGSIYQKISWFAEAEKHLTAAYEICASELDEKEEHAILTMEFLGALYREQGRFSEAEPLLVQALENQTKAWGTDHAKTAKTGLNLGMLRAAQGRYSEAEAIYRTSLGTLEATVGASSEATLEALVNLASVCTLLDQFEESERLGIRALQLAKQLHGEDSPTTLNVLNNLATHYQEHGSFAKAEPIYREALDLSMKLMGEQHSSTLAVMGNLALLYQNQGRPLKAEKMQLKVLEIQTEILGPEHPSTLRTTHNLLSEYIKRGKYDKASPLMDGFLDARTRVMGPEHPETIKTMGLSADLHKGQGKKKLAEEVYLQAIEISDRVLSAEHSTTVRLKADLADIYLHALRFEEAKVLLEKVLEARKSTLGSEHPHTLDAMESLARIHMQLKQGNEAIVLMEELLEIRTRLMGAEDPTILGATTNLGMVYSSMGRHPEAAKLFEKSLPIKERVLGLDHPWTWIAVENLARAYMAMGQEAESMPLRRRLLKRSIAPADSEDASPEILNQAAWTLLTIKPETMQDHTQALLYATRACEQAVGSKIHWALLDTLALAQFKTGDIKAAAKNQRRAFELMPEGADAGVVERVAEYEAAAKAK